MAAILALLPNVLQLIQLAVPGVENLIAWVNTIRTSAQQTGEWTPALESSFVTALVAYSQAPEWQPDPPKTISG